MLRIAFWLTAAGLGFADVSPPPDRHRAERLGNSYRYEGSTEDRGLAVEIWRNHSLGRTELWHRPVSDYYLRVDERTYLRGRHDGEEWTTDPAERLVFRDGTWRKLAPPGRRS